MSTQSSGPSPATWIAIAVGGCGCLLVAAVVVVAAAGVLFGVRVAPPPPPQVVTVTTQGQLAGPGPGASPDGAITPLQATGVPDEVLFVQPAALDGLYFRIQMWSGSISQEHFFFSPDGRVVQGVPKGGLDAGTMDRMQKEEVQRWELVGEKLVITDAAGKRREHDFKRAEGQDLELDGLFTQRVSSFTKERRLEGSWGSSASAGGGTGATVSGAWTLTFRPDGSFTASGVGGTSIETRGGSAGAQSSSESTGTYTLSGNTLVLEHGDGRQTRHTVYPYGEDEQTARPERINVDGRMYKREG